MRRTEATFLRRSLWVFLGERVGINAAQKARAHRGSPGATASLSFVEDYDQSCTVQARFLRLLVRS